jgi:hypothetical protein
MGSKRSTLIARRKTKLRKFARNEENNVEYNYKERASVSDATQTVEHRDGVSLPVRLDPEAYRKYIALQGLTDHEKDEMIGVVMSIVQSFVDRAFGIDPKQEAHSAAMGCQSSQDDVDTETGARALRMDANLPSLNPEGS